MSPDQSLITVIVVTYRGLEFLADCLKSLAQQTVQHRALVIDNASTDGTAEMLTQQFPSTRVIRLSRNTGFAGGMAAGIDHVETPYFALLNDDATAEPDWLETLLRAIESDSRTAAATSEMWLTEPPATLNNLGVALTPSGYGYDIGLAHPATHAFESITPVFGFSGGAALVRTSAARAVGGSPVDFFLYYEDVDLSWRLQLAGLGIVSAPGARVLHRHSATVGQTSPGFHRYNERNRLAVLIRCAPGPFAIAQLGRFVLTTVSLAVKRATRRPIPRAANFSVRLRVRVLIELIGRAVPLLQERRKIGRQAQLPRAEVAARWLGQGPFTASADR